MKVENNRAYRVSDKLSSVGDFLFPRCRCIAEFNPTKKVVESLFEEVRQKQFANCISRLDCLFVFRLESDMIEYSELLSNNSLFFYELELFGEVEWHDMKLFTEEGIIHAAKKELLRISAQKYWRGERSKGFSIEGLFKGTARVKRIIPHNEIIHFFEGEDG